MKFFARVRGLVLQQISDLGEMLRYLRTRRKSPFGLKACGRGFADHSAGDLSRLEPARHRAAVERVLDAYHRAKQDEGQSAEPYRLRGEWRHIIDVEYARLLDALRRKDVERLGDLLSNLCRNECSRGLSLSAAFVAGRRRPFYRFRFIMEFNEEFESWRREDPKTPFEPEAFVLPRIGNLLGMQVGGHLIAPPSIRHRFYARRIGQLKGEGRAQIVEIGGGFGGMAYFLLKEFPRLHYANFDLPEINVVCGYYLLMALPDRKAALYGESSRPLPEVLGAHELVIYPHFTFSQISDRSADLVFNSNSLTEMDKETVEEYYRQIARITRGYFFHTNHDDEKIYDAKLGKRHIKLSAYALPDPPFKTLLHMRPAYYHPKYFEYLYQCCGR